MDTSFFNQLDICILLYNGNVEAAGKVFRTRFLKFAEVRPSKDMKNFLYAMNFGIYYYVLFRENISLDECCNRNNAEINIAGFSTEALLESGLHTIYHYGYCAEYLVKQYKNTSIRRAVLYIHQNLSADISLESLAFEAGLSKNQLCALFKHETGLTAGCYILKRRIRTAKELLSNTEMSIAIIAESCGFHTLSYFCTLFKKETGLSPLQYRKQQIC